MASILRSGKFLRYFAGFTRNIAFNPIRETEGSLVQNTSCLCSSLTQGFATAAPRTDQNLEKQLKRLDQDVRRTGRISRRDIEEVLEEIRTQRSATSSQSLLVIRCCGNLVPEELPEVRTALVQEIWKTLNTLNVPMDVSHYNALLRVYLENEHEFSPTDFLADLEAKGVEPNRVTYQRLISRYCQLGDIDGATRILEFMREKGLPVNENVFNALILGHSQANDLESATAILTVMKQAGLEPSADTYTTLICCYARHGDLDSILRTLDECEKNEIYLLDKDLLDVVYNLTINGHGDKVDKVLEKMRKSIGYNQDAVNVILRLTNKGFEDVALKILRTMPRAARSDGELNDTGNFFIRQLVKASRPVEKILEICKALQEEGLNQRAVLIATEAGLTHGMTNNALPLLKEMQQSGLPIRQHYFWPLICSVDSNEIVDVLQKMQSEFSVNPNSETIREYVIPNLKEKNWERIINVLRNAGVSSGTAVASATYSAVTANKLKDAAKITESHRAFYSPALFKKPLIVALSNTNDYQSFVRIVRQVYDGLSKANGNEQNVSETEETGEAEATNGNNSPAEFLGQIVLEGVTFFKQNRVEFSEKLLSALVKQGLTISNKQAERIQERIGSEMNDTISELLGKLASGELEPVQLEKPKKSGNSLDRLTIDEIQRYITNLDQKKENTAGIKRYLINACLKSKNIQKTEEVIENLEKENYTVSNAVYAQVIDLYVHHAKLDSALSLLDKISKKDETFSLDQVKLVKIAGLMVSEGKFDEAIKFLEANKKDVSDSEGDSSFNYNTTCWRLLNSLAEAGKTAELETMFTTLEKNNYIQPTNVLLGPLIKVHLVNNDVEKAINTFEKLCEKHKSTPWKNELACRLIQNEDATNLQRLTDLSTTIHGEVNSLYDLVFSFVECGRIRQARKILETPGLRSRPQRINSACERYRQEGMVEPLEGLVEATRDLNHIDRNKIYFNLLLSYRKENNPEKALGLWTKMQEEDITPSEEFLTSLANFLKEKKIEVPFVLNNSVPIKAKKQKQPKTVTSEESSKKAIAKKAEAEPKQSGSENLAKFRKAIRGNDVDQALSIRKELKSIERPSVADLSYLIESLIKADRISEANKIVHELLADKLYPIPKVFKFYLNKLASSGDVEGIEKIGLLINEETKKLVSFDNRYCHANIQAGKVEHYLKKLDADFDNAKTEEEFKKIADKFPRGGALGILEKHPELSGQFEELAEKFAKKGFIAPINVLWIYNCISHNAEASQNIWTKYLKDSPRLMFQRVLQTARDNQDDKLAENLISHLRESKVSEGAIGNAYSCFLDVLTGKNKIDEALSALNNAVKDVCLENINRTALLRLKQAAEAAGKAFPHNIPEKKAVNDTSSSSSGSSDDDVTPQKPETAPKKDN